MDEQLEVSAMVSERQKLQARVADFSKTLPDAGGVPRALKTVELPRAASVVDLPVSMWSQSADRRFSRKLSMRGRARWNSRPNLNCDRCGADLLEDMNFGRCSELTDEQRLHHGAYYVDRYGAQVRDLMLFGAYAGATMYLSRKERNHMQHALVGNTGPSKKLRGAKGAAVAHEIRLVDFGDRLGRWRNKCLQVSVCRLAF